MEISQTHNYNARAEELFAHLTDAEKLCTWWTTKATSDARDGGEFRYEFLHAPEKAEMDMIQQGTYTACSSGHISYPWQTPAGESTVTFTVTSGQIKLAHTNLPDNKELLGMLDQGWNMFLQNLGSIMKGGPDARAQMGLLTV